MNESEFDEDDMLFWASVVIYVEQEVKPKLNGFFINNKRLKSFLKQNNITLKWDKFSKLSFPENPDENTIIFSIRKNIVADLLCHLRNAFAHLYIEKNSTGDYILSDHYRNKSLNMKGRIKQGLLKKLFEQIKATRSIKGPQT